MAEPALAPRRDLVLLVLFRICRSLAAGMISLAFPYYVLRTLHHSALTLGFIYTGAAIATAALGLLCGFLSDVWGRKPTLLIVAVLLPLSSLCVYLFSGVSWLFAAALVGGYSATGSLMGGGVGGAAQPIQNAVLADLTPPEVRTSWFSGFTFTSGLFAAGGTLLARAVSVHGAFLVATLFGTASLLLLLPLRLHERRGSVRTLKSVKTIGKFSLTGALNGFSQGLVTPFLIPFFMLVYHLPKDAMSIYGFAAGVLGAFALLLAPALDRRLGFVKSIAITRGLGAVLLLLMPLVKHLPFSLLVYLLTPALRVAALPAQQAALTGMVSGEETGRALGINQVTRLASSSGAITLTGWLFSEASFAAPFFLYAAILGVNIGLYFKFFGADGTRAGVQRG